jgi:hypothetical protein
MFITLYYLWGQKDFVSLCVSIRTRTQSGAQEQEDRLIRPLWILGCGMLRGES